jgi:hypothetical protein
MSNTLSAGIQVALFCIALISLIDAPDKSASKWLSPLRSPLFFVASVVAIFLIGRWPWLSVSRELNPDESVFLASAFRFLQDIVPWRATHNGTSGPLTSWMLAFIGILGIPLNYITAHFVSFGLQILTVCFAYGTIRNLAGETPARLSTLPVALLLSRTGDPNFIHLSSENFPLALMAGGCYAASRGFTESVTAGKERGWLFISGILLGAVGFAKLQAGPMALVISIIILGGLLGLPVSGRARLTKIIPFSIGVLLIPTIILGMVLLGGAWDDFWNFYVESNLVYGNQSPARLSQFELVRILIFQSPGFSLLLQTTGALSAVAVSSHLLQSRASLNQKQKRMLIASATLLLAALFCIAKPGIVVPHYLLLLVLPVILYFGTLLNIIWSNRTVTIWMILSMGATCFPALLGVSETFSKNIRFLEGKGIELFILALNEAPKKPESEFISKLLKSDDQCAIWGWRNDIYVEGCPRPAVRYLVPGLTPETFRDYLRNGFLKDVHMNKPRLLVDAVCFSGSTEIGWYTTAPSLERKLEGYEPNLPLQEYITKHYVLAKQVPCNPGDWVIQDLLGKPGGRLPIEDAIKIYERKNDG